MAEPGRPLWRPDSIKFALLAVLALLSAASAHLLGDTQPPPPVEADGSPALQIGRAWTVPVLIALLAIVLQNAAIGAAWDYLQLLADQHHFAPDTAGIAVSGGLICQVAGACAVAIYGERLPLRTALIGGILGQGALIALLAVADTPLLYVATALSFGVLWVSLMPFQVRLLIDLDPTRSAALVFMALTLVGLSIGPSIAALGVRGADVTGAYWVAVVMTLIGTSLYMMCPSTRQTP